MPTPERDETRDAFVERCVPVVLEDGAAGTGEQAVAICHSLYDQHEEDTMDKQIQEPQERKFLPFIVTKIDEPQGIVEHSVAVFGNIDLGGDRIKSGAFTKTISERFSQIRVLDSHQTDSIMRVIGRPLEMHEVGRSGLDQKVVAKYPDATGALMATTQFLMDTPEGSGAFKRIASGAVGEYSIGYDPIKVDFTEEEDGDKKRVVRELLELRLWEYSPVIFGMNDATSTVSAKAVASSLTEKVSAAFYALTTDPSGEKQYGIQFVKDFIRATSRADGKGYDIPYTVDGDDVTFAPPEDWTVQKTKNGTGENKGANGASNLPLADRDRAWDADAAIAGMRKATGSEEEPSAGYKRGFFWHDSEEPASFGAYKLPFADAEGDALTAVPKGIFAAAAAIQGARGGVDIPSEDMAQVRNRISNYYGRMRQEFDDDGIVPPWEKAEPVAFVTKQNLAEFIGQVARAFYMAYPDDMDQVWWVDEVHDTHCIVRRESPVGNATYRVGYAQDGAGDILFQSQGEWMEVEHVWVPKALRVLAEYVSESEKWKLPSISAEEIEAKVGRVLAQRNANRISAALAALIEVLEDAGINLGGGEEPDEEDEEKETGALPGEEAALDQEADDEPEEAGPAETSPTSRFDKGALLEQIHESLLRIDTQLSEE